MADWFHWSSTVARRVTAGGALALAGLRGVLPETGVTAADELAPVVLSTVLNTGSFAPMLGFLLNAAFFFIIFATFVPQLYPDSLGAAQETLVFRLSVGTTGMITALPLYYVLLNTTAPVSWPPVLGIPVGVALSAIVFRDWARRDVGIESPSEFLAEVLVGESTTSPDDELPAWINETKQYAELIAGVLVLFAPAYLAGILGGVLGTFFPVLELLVVAGVVASRFGFVLPDQIRDHLRRGRSFETRAYDSLSASIRHSRGIAGICTCLIGFVLGSIPLIIGFGGYDITVNNTVYEWTVLVSVTTNVLASGSSPVVLPRFVVDAVAITVFLVSLPLLTAYYCWYWYRQLRRMPAALRYANATSLADRSLPPVGRPPFLLIPATVLFVLTLMYERWYEFGLEKWVTETLLAVAGPVLIAVLFVGIRRSLRVPRRYPTRDGVATIAAFSITCAGTYATWFAFGVTAIAPVVFLPVMMAVGYYFKSIVDYASSLSPVANALVVLTPLAAFLLFALPGVPFNWRTAASFVLVVPLLGYASVAKRYEE